MPEDRKNPMLDAALEYAAHGWCVVPLHTARRSGRHRCSCRRPDCPSPGKHPLVRRWPHVATRDLKQVRRFWKKWPNANIGIATGAGSGVAVLDVDLRSGGHETLSQLEAEYGPLPRTVEALTGGGGRHLFFAHPGQRVKNKAGFAPGLDIRGDGGLIVAPPSIHASGRDYQWRPGQRPGQLPLATMPEWLLEAGMAPPKRIVTRNQPDQPYPVTEANSELFHTMFGLLGIHDLPDQGQVMRCCPWHDDTTPSLSIHVGLGTFHCFGCGSEGGVAELARRVISTKAVSFNPNGPAQYWGLKETELEAKAAWGLIPETVLTCGRIPRRVDEMVNTETGQHRLRANFCGHLACPRCGPRRMAGHLLSLAHHFKSAEHLYVARIAPDDWAAVKKQLDRAGAEFASVDTKSADSGLEKVIFSSCPSTRSEPVTLTQATETLVNSLLAAHYDRGRQRHRIVNTSRGWKAVAPEKTPWIVIAQRIIPDLTGFEHEARAAGVCLRWHEDDRWSASKICDVSYPLGWTDDDIETFWGRVAAYPDVARAPAA